MEFVGITSSEIVIVVDIRYPLLFKQKDTENQPKFPLPFWVLFAVDMTYGVKWILWENVESRVLPMKIAIVKNCKCVIIIPHCHCQ